MNHAFNDPAKNEKDQIFENRELRGALNDLGINPEFLNIFTMVVDVMKINNHIEGSGELKTMQLPPKVSKT